MHYFPSDTPTVAVFRAIYIMSSSKRTVTRASTNPFNIDPDSDSATDVSASAFVAPRRSRKKPDILNISRPAVKRREVAAPKKKRSRSCDATVGSPKNHCRPRGTTVAARDKSRRSHWPFRLAVHPWRLLSVSRSSRTGSLLLRYLG